jgi:hypothetical protein
MKSLADVDASSGGGRPSTGEVQPFLAAIARVLRETVAAFESTVETITELTIKRQDRADRELLVALQDFDRLQQEFAALGEVIARLSRNTVEPHRDADALAVISIADLKDRLALHLRVLSTDLPTEEAEDVVF